jgi:hypothetical protein
MADQTRVDILAGGLITALGVLLLGAASWMGYGRYVILKRWPTIQAEVTRSEVSGPVRMGSSITSNLTYYTQIEFHFLLDGRQVRASGREKSDNSSGAQMEAKAYAPGTRHLIRYNPDNPEDIRFSAEDTLELPVILGMVGAGAFYSGLRWLLRARRSGNRRTGTSSAGKPSAKEVRPLTSLE